MKLVRILIILCVLCVSAVNTVRSEDWTSFGRDTYRTGSTSEKLSTSFAEIWHYAGASEIVSSPAIGDGFVVFASRDGYVRALREFDGYPLWSFPYGSGIVSSPAISQGRVYIASGGKVYCLRLSDGIPLWNYVTSGTDISSPTISGNILYLGSGFPNQKVLAINLSTRDKFWEQTVEQIVYSSAAISGTKVIIGCDSGRYYALNKDTGSEVWSFPTDGAVLLSSPLISGTSVYLLPGGNNNNFYSIDIDSAITNYQIALTDPFSPTNGTIIGTKLSTSSPMKVGNFVGFVVRFDYTIDTNNDTILDKYVMNEYAVVIDPITPTASVKWQELLGNSGISATQGAPPALGLCPTPASMELLSSGQALVVLSSISPKLFIFEPSSGNNLGTYNLDSAGQSSVTVANSRIYVATRNGSLYALQCSGNHAPAPPVSGFLPANNDTIRIGASSPGGLAGTITPTITWSPAMDSDNAHISATLQYLIRVDDDNEVLENSDFEFLTQAGVVSVTLPAMAVTGSLKLTYAIRTIDPAGAYSGWSDVRSFLITLDTTPPEPATNLKVTPSNGFVDLFWTASTSSDVSDYLVSYKQEGGSFGSLSRTGGITTYRVNGLTNGISYTFQVISEDGVGLRSSPIEISAIPNYVVYVNGVPCDSLSGAVSIAQAGDTITLGAVTFILQNTLSLKEGVNIRGVLLASPSGGPHQTILDATDLSAAIRLSSSVSATKGTISNLMILGASNGIDTSFYKVVIKNTVIKNCDNGIYGNDTSDMDVINNTIISNRYAGVDVSGKTMARNNIIMNNGYGIYWGGTLIHLSDLSISYNNVYGTTCNYANCSVGAGDISEDVTFIDEANNDYREQTGAQTIDMGDPVDDWSQEPEPNGDRINMGAYGNTSFATKSSIIVESSGVGVSKGNKFIHCFIATAAYGSPLAKPVIILKQFRDEYLLTNTIGQWFVRQYYRNSPPLARYIANHSVARRITQIILIPVVVYAYLMVHPAHNFYLWLVMYWVAGGIWLGIRKYKKKPQISQI
ncbi:MAG: PQQ-binding-like beta-propeller repeat protein [Planctomycetota bacterium]